MGKILLVEPDRILRHAIGLFLFPENDVRVEERITDLTTKSLEGYDLLILDGPELRERGWWSPELGRAIQDSGAPILWLEADDGVQPPETEEGMVLRKPVKREALGQAVASFFSGPGADKKLNRRSAPASDKGHDAGEGAAHEVPSASTESESLRFIDLVDAVEEEPSPNQAKKSPRMPE
jgi:hypothetical protein